MILADTSAWIEFLRGGEGRVAGRLAELIAAGEVAVTEPVAMEVLAGARSAEHENELRRLLATAAMARVGDLGSWERAGTIFRVCRAAGVTLRSQLDCLVAAVAIREDLAVLHADRDFHLIARSVPLRLDAAD